MPHPTSRRNFLKQSGAAAAGTLGLAVGYSVKAARAIEPIARPGEAKFKFSLAAYSYRNLLSGSDPKLTLFDFIDDCAALNLEGTELTSYYFRQPVTAEYLLQLKRHAFLLGLDISGTAVGNDFGHPEGETRRQQIEMVKTWIDHAAVLGAPVIRIFAGHKKGDMSDAEAHRLFVSGIEEACDYAGTKGVFLALENHGGPTSTAQGMLAIVRDVSSPWFGVNADTGNFHSDDLYGEIAAIAPYAVNVQVKVVVSGPDRVKHPADMPRLAQIFRDAGYRGYIVLEYEEAGDPREECRRYMDQLREAFS